MYLLAVHDGDACQSERLDDVGERFVTHRGRQERPEESGIDEDGCLLYTHVEMNKGT